MDDSDSDNLSHYSEIIEFSKFSYSNDYSNDMEEQENIHKEVENIFQRLNKNSKDLVNNNMNNMNNNNMNHNITNNIKSTQNGRPDSTQNKKKLNTKSKSEYKLLKPRDFKDFKDFKDTNLLNKNHKGNKQSLFINPINKRHYIPNIDITLDESETDLLNNKSRKDRNDNNDNEIIPISTPLFNNLLKNQVYINEIGNIVSSDQPLPVIKKKTTKNEHKHVMIKQETLMVPDTMT